MNTLLLRWNPAFSSFSMLDYLQCLAALNTSRFVDFNWSVWDHDKIHAGDRIYWQKLGFGATGLFGTGLVTSEPYEEEDWSGKGRQTFYVDFEAEVLINPDALPIFQVAPLAARFPDFEWARGHSGVVLPPDAAEMLDSLWREFMAENADEFAKKRASKRRINDYFYSK